LAKNSLEKSGKKGSEIMDNGFKVYCPVCKKWFYGWAKSKACPICRSQLISEEDIADQGRGI